MKKREVFVNIFYNKNWQESVERNNILFLATNTCHFFFYYKNVKKLFFIFSTFFRFYFFENLNIFREIWFLKVQLVTFSSINKTFCSYYHLAIVLLTPNFKS